MSRVDFSPKEEECLLEILQRYLPELESEIANTDDKKFRKALEGRKVLMEDFINRLQTAVV